MFRFICTIVFIAAIVALTIFIIKEVNKSEIFNNILDVITEDKTISE